MVSEALSDTNAADRMHRELLLKFATADPDCTWLQHTNANPIFIIVKITLADDTHLLEPCSSKVVERVWRQCSGDKVPVVGTMDET